MHELDHVNNTIEQLRSAVDEYKAQKGRNVFPLFHISLGISLPSALQVREAEYLEALGDAILAIGKEIWQVR